MAPAKKPTPAAPNRKFIEQYLYHDEKGILLYRVCRFAVEGGSKSFTQSKPNPSFDKTKKEDKENNPQFLPTVEGVRKVLYRLPELIGGIKANPKRFILVCEGEKDVNLAHANGLIATTNAGGALKWDDSYNEFFQDVNVVVIPDNDPVDPNYGWSPGMKHAREVCTAIYPFAASVRLLELPGVGPKGDFSDWWTKQNEQAADKKTALGNLIKACPMWRPEEDSATEDDGSNNETSEEEPPGEPEEEVAAEEVPASAMPTAAPPPSKIEPPAATVPDEAIMGTVLARLGEQFSILNLNVKKFRSSAEMVGAINIVINDLATEVNKNPLSASFNGMNLPNRDKLVGCLYLLSAICIKGIGEL